MRIARGQWSAESSVSPRRNKASQRQRKLTMSEESRPLALPRGDGKDGRPGDEKRSVADVPVVDAQPSDRYARRTLMLACDPGCAKVCGGAAGDIARRGVLEPRQVRTSATSPSSRLELFVAQSFPVGNALPDEDPDVLVEKGCALSPHRVPVPVLRAWARASGESGGGSRLSRTTDGLWSCCVFARCGRQCANSLASATVGFPTMVARSMITAR